MHPYAITQWGLCVQSPTTLAGAPTDPPVAEFDRGAVRGDRDSSPVELGALRAIDDPAERRWTRSAGRFMTRSSALLPRYKRAHDTYRALDVTVELLLS